MQLKYGPETDKYLKEIKETYSFAELLQDLEDGLGDIYLGFCNMNFITYRQFDITYFVLEDSVIWIVPKPKKIEDWRLLVTVFTSKLWLSIVAGFFCCVTIFTAIAICTSSGRFDNVANCFFLIYSTFLNMGYNIYPRTFKLRIICVCLVLFALNINAYLQGKLYSNMSQPVYEKEIANTVELLETGMPLIFNRATSLLFLFNGPVNLQVYRTYIPSNNTNAGDDLIEVVENQNFATIVTESILNTRPYARPLVTKFDVVRLKASMCVKRHYVLFEKIDELVKKFVEHGFVEKLTSQLKHSCGLLCYTNENCSSISNKRTVKLSYQNLEAAFFVYKVGLAVACVAFVVEMFIGYLKRSFVYYKSSNF